MSLKKIFFNSADTTGKSQALAALAYLKCQKDADLIDTAGEDEAGLTALYSGITNATLDDIFITNALVDSHAEAQFTTTQAIAMIAKLKTARQGTNVTGTCQANSTLTNIKLAASGPSDTDDAYNLMLIATAGDVEVNRLITDYNGTTHVCTVTTTGSLVDVSETYTVYTTEYLHIWGHANGSTTNLRVAFDDAYPDASQYPLLLELLDNGDSLFEKNNLTATSVSSDGLTDTGEFVAEAYDGKDYYVAIYEATTGGGQKARVISNTANKLTISHWPKGTPTGTVKYQLVDGHGALALYPQYMLYAITTYLTELDSYPDQVEDLMEMIDQWDMLNSGKYYAQPNLSLIDDYAEKGKAIADAVFAGVVS